MSATALRELAALRARCEGRDRYAGLLLQLSLVEQDEANRLDLFERFERNLVDWERQEDRIAVLLDELAVQRVVTSGGTVRQVACEFCGAVAGAPCSTTYGRQRATEHRRRWDSLRVASVVG